MALNIPESAAEVVAAAKIDVQREMATSNPFLRNSFLGGIVTGIANRIWDFYYSLKKASLEAMPDTARINLDRWVAIWGLTRTVGQTATGTLGIAGTAGNTVPIGHPFVSSSGNTYTATSAGTVALVTVFSASITSLSGTVGTKEVTVVLTFTHNYSVSNFVWVTGATETEYNTLAKIKSVIDGTSFTYETVDPITSSPATGSPQFIVAYANVNIQSDESGNDKNLAANELVSLAVPITGIDSDQGVTYGGVTGGTDQETDIALRARLLDRLRNPVSHFNVNEIVATAKAINGVTRVFVDEVTKAGVATVGACDIYFMRDNDANPIPNGAQVAEVNTAIQAIRPANTAAADVLVLAPVAEPTAFLFNSITPDTTTMRAAVTANLEAFFDEVPEVGVNVVSEAFGAAIFNTVDTTNGQSITSYVLTTPAGDITVTAGKIATLAGVSYT
jgi:uncharacterized phage protein gp47/JayE